MSASPLIAVWMAAPVPCERKFTVIQGYFVWKAGLIALSSTPVSYRLDVDEIVSVIGEGVGVGVGLGVGVGVGVGEVVGDGDGETLGEGVGEADGVGVGEVVGD